MRISSIIAVVFAVFSVFSTVSAQVRGYDEYVDDSRVVYYNNENFPSLTYQSTGTSVKPSVTVDTEKVEEPGAVSAAIPDSVQNFLDETKERSIEYIDSRILRQDNDIAHQTVRRERWPVPATTPQSIGAVAEGYGD